MARRVEITNPAKRHSAVLVGAGMAVRKSRWRPKYVVDTPRQGTYTVASMSRSAAPLLDAIDRALLDALQDDCKQPLAKLGERVGLSAPSVLERVRKLEQSGLITGYHAVIDPRVAGFDVGAFIGIGIDHPRSIPGFEEAVLAIPEVLECHHVTGRHTLMIKVRTQNTESLHRLISLLRELPGVARTETMVVLETQLERQRLVLPAVSEEDTPTPRRRARHTRSEVPEA
ncbi:Lrp/AsnC family transcriptional regulator [Sandaracinus amylolyticus]|nr:Lrp/AsnC family transcriptional regulator [Sandaracinus amylolyticus]